MSPHRKKRFARRLDQARHYRPDNGDQEHAIVVSLDEFETMRLCDYELLSQVDAAKDMNVSRATIQRLLQSGRQKITKAVLTHRGFRIENSIEHIKLKGENRMGIDTKNVKRIAFPTSDRKHVDQHFGHTESFCVYTVKDNRVIDTDYLTPPPHKPGVLPLFLRDQGVDVIITGGMGNKAVDLFKHNNIDVILGARGPIEQNLEEFFGGDLESTVSPCSHDHGDHSHESRPNHGTRSNQDD